MAERKFGSAEKCDICTKTVYALEKLTADGKIFHKNCLRCDKCKKVLSLGNYAVCNEQEAYALCTYVIQVWFVLRLLF